MPRKLEDGMDEGNERYDVNGLQPLDGHLHDYPRTGSHSESIAARLFTFVPMKPITSKILANNLKQKGNPNGLDDTAVPQSYDARCHKLEKSSTRVPSYRVAMSPKIHPAQPSLPVILG